MPPQSAHYRSAASLTLRACDEGFLVFDEESGQTSVLDSRAGKFLLALTAQDAPLDAPQGDALPEFQAMLSRLEDCGLIVRC